MKTGIIGLPQSGKTSLYNALTRSQVNLASYGSSEVYTGVIPVPDERFEYAVQQCNPKKISPATIEVTEGGARIERTPEGGRRDKFGADFFANVRNMDALVLVVAAFENALGAGSSVDPARDANQVLEELLLADLTVVEGRIERLDKARLQKRQTPGEAAEQQVLQRIREHLEKLQPIRTLDLSDEEQRSIRSYAFVSGKPIIVAVNVAEDAAADAVTSVTNEISTFCAEQHIQMITLSARVEMEVAQMEPDDERDFLQAMGITEAARDRLIRACYAALGVMSFFTVGEDEVRAWTIPANATSLKAAETIHSDLARGFIRAEVIGFEDFRSAGGCWDEARAAGKMHLEGREYLVKDGDILHVRFKV